MYEIGKWVAVKFNKQWYLGEVVDTSDNEIEIRCMGITGGNKFAWPEKDVCWYENSDIICSIEPPTPVSHRVFGLCREDLEKVKELTDLF